MREGRGRVFRGVGAWGINRSFDARQIRSVEVKKTLASGDSGTKFALSISADKEVRFGAMLPEKRLTFLAAALRAELLSGDSRQKQADAPAN